MTFDNFIKKYKGKFVEVAGGPQNQCVDLANAYIRDVLGLPIIEWTNAVDFPLKASREDYDYILNTPNAVPIKGDIIIWSGEWGHIAIFVEGDVNSFVSFDQNWPTGAPSVLVGHDYQNVLGWLRPKKASEDDTMVISKTDFENLIKEGNEREEIWEKLGHPKDTPVETIINAINGMKSRETDLSNQLIEAKTKLESNEERLALANEELLNRVNEITALKVKIKALTDANGKLEGVYKGQIISLEKRIETLIDEKEELKRHIGLLEKENKGFWDYLTLAFKKLV